MLDTAFYQWQLYQFILFLIFLVCFLQLYPFRELVTNNMLSDGSFWDFANEQDFTMNKLYEALWVSND